LSLPSLSLSLPFFPLRGKRERKGRGRAIPSSSPLGKGCFHSKRSKGEREGGTASSCPLPKGQAFFLFYSFSPFRSSSKNFEWKGSQNFLKHPFLKGFIHRVFQKEKELLFLTLEDLRCSKEEGTRERMLYF